MIKTTALAGIHYWSRPQPDRGIDFNGFLWTRPGGNVLIDPLEMDAAELAAVQGKGGARWILLSNFDHLRAAAPLKRLLGATVLAPAGEHPRFGAQADLVDQWFTASSDLPAELRDDVLVHVLPGGKSPVELAFLLRGPRALYFGDAVRAHVAGRLNLLPDPKLADRAALIAALRPLAALEFDGLLLGDGDNVLFHGKQAFAELLARLG